MKITCAAPAKINLMLHVVGLLEDGYHHLQSIVAFTEMGDEITIESTRVFGFTATGPFASQLPPIEENSVAKAAEWFSQKFRIYENFHIHLHKNLPLASGMGGGSADAAAAIAALMKLCTISLSVPEQEDIILSSGFLGADVPVCLTYHLRGTPLLWIDSSGRETVPQPVERDLPRYAVLANPGMPVSTPAIFKAIRPPYTPSQPFILPQDLPVWLKAQKNDLMPPALEQVGNIQDIIQALQNQSGCVMARMTGSGATCFGLYGSKETADAAGHALQLLMPEGWVAVSALRGARGYLQTI